MNLAALVALDRYPLMKLDTASGSRFAAKLTAQYRADGLCHLPQFLKPGALTALQEEARKLQGKAYFVRGTHTVYLEKGGDPKNGNPAKAPEQTEVGSVAYDLLPEHGLLRTLYQWKPLKELIRRVLDKPRLHYFADPLGACSINVFRAGGKHGWHFDEAEFTTTLMLQSPECGGAFEYVPQIRGLPEEQTLVSRILGGEREGVCRLPFTEGSLLIFGGRQTLHRVTEIFGSVSRLVPVLCYTEQPNETNSDAVRQYFWGRTT